MHCRISYCSQSKSQPELRIHLLHHDRGFSLFRGVHVIASQNQNCFVTNSPLQSSHAETKANANLLLLVPVPSCSSFQLPQSVLMRSVLSQILHCKAAMQKLRAMPCQPASILVPVTTQQLAVSIKRSDAQWIFLSPGAAD